MPLPPRLAAAAVLAAAAAVAAGFLLWPRANHLPPCPSQRATPLSAAGQKKLDTYQGRIQYEVDRSSDGERTETWTDPVTGRMRTLSFDSQGQLISEEELSWSGTTQQDVLVSFADYTSTTTSSRVPAGYVANSDDAAANSLLMRQEIATGTSVVVGRAVVDGRATLHLRETIKVPKLSPTALGLPAGMTVPNSLTQPRTEHADIWVDPLTYLTVQARSQETGGVSVSDITWLPRTALNLAATTFVAPQSFRHISDQSSSVPLTATVTPATDTACRQP
jgi:hypothetical protein